MEKDVRWKQRFQNFERAFLFLQEALKEPDATELERAGTIQAFEFTSELGWKTLKDFLEAKQVAVSFPRDIIKEAFSYHLIEDGETWMDMLDKRNLMSHTYDEEKSALAYSLIRNNYFKALSQLHERLKKEL